MPILLLKFAIRLEAPDGQTPYYQHYGPVFHRWLPDGVGDAVVLSTDNPEATLKVWFKRLGFVEKSDDVWFTRIKFAYDRQEVDAAVIPRQSILEAGPLWGLLRIQKVPEDTLQAVQEGRRGDPQYIALAKQVIKLLHPPISRFINILRINYGQYWIRELESWDSRLLSIGAYCNQLGLSYSLDNEKTWHEFVPDQIALKVQAGQPLSQHTYREYLTEDDWQELATVVNQGNNPSIAALTLARTHQLLDQHHVRQAFVEGVTAMELGIDDFVREKLDGNRILGTTIQSFWTLPLPTRFVTAAMMVGNIPQENIEQTIEAITVRNKITHEGLQPTEDDLVKLRTLMKTIAKFIPSPLLRFPSAAASRISMLEEDWDQLMDR